MTKGKKYLSKREHEVALLVAEGLNNQAIADRLSINIKTVEHHLRSIFKYLQSVHDTRDKHLRVLLSRTILDPQVSPELTARLEEIKSIIESVLPLLKQY